MSNSQSGKLDELAANAAAEGGLSQKALNSLSIVDVGQQINTAMGVSIETVKAGEILLVGTLVDDSSSIAEEKWVSQPGGADILMTNEQPVRDGHNMLAKKLQRVKQRNGILAHAKYLNGKVLYPFVPIDQVTLMDGRNYKGNGGTPLDDSAMLFLITMALKAQECAEAGDPVRTMTLLISDGEDTSSKQFRTKDVFDQVKKMLSFEGQHIIAGMGVYNGRTDFRKVFSSMGIPDQWIWEPTSDPNDLATAFNVWSESAVRASQSATAFSQTATAGGFGN